MPSQLALMQETSLTALPAMRAMIAMVKLDRDVDQVSDVVRRAKLGRQYADIHKAASEIKETAYVLECTALRRLGQLRVDEFMDRPEHITREVWGNLDVLARMTEEEFDEAIRKQIKDMGGGSPASLIREIKRQCDWRIMRERMARWQAGEEPDGPVFDRITDWTEPGTEFSSWDHPRNVEHVREAVSTLIGQVSQDETHTVDHLADVVLEAMQLDNQGINTMAAMAMRSVVRAALNECVGADERGAVLAAEVSTGGRWPKFGDGWAVPRFLTVLMSGTWMRVPWRLATIQQLQWFVEYREKQASELAQKAAQHRELLTALSAEGLTGNCAERVKQLVARNENARGSRMRYDERSWPE